MRCLHTDLYDSPVAMRSPSTWAVHARRTAARKLHLSLMAIDNLKIMQICRAVPLPFQASDLAVQHSLHSYSVTSIL